MDRDRLFASSLLKISQAKHKVSPSGIQCPVFQKFFIYLALEFQCYSNQLGDC